MGESGRGGGEWERVGESGRKCERVGEGGRGCETVGVGEERSDGQPASKIIIENMTVKNDDSSEILSIVAVVDIFTVGIVAGWLTA